MKTLPEICGLRGDAHRIINRAIRDALPAEAVRSALDKLAFSDGITLVAVGKAAWEMAAAATRRSTRRAIPCRTSIPSGRPRRPSIW